MNDRYNAYKYMFSVGYKIPGEYAIFSAWYGGNTEEEAKANAVKCALNYHNVICKRKEPLLTESDINIVECKLSGDYGKVLKDLENDRS